MYYKPYISGGGMQFTNRNNLAAVDFDFTTLTRDDAYHDLDLSPIIPEGTKMVRVGIRSVETALYDTVCLDDGGTTNHEGQYNCYNMATHNVFAGDIVDIVPDSNRKIKYKIKTTAITGGITIRGWWV